MGHEILRSRFAVALLALAAGATTHAQSQGGASSAPTSAAAAQARKSVAVQVTEATGIRRTEYPVSARVPFTRGALPGTDHVRLILDGADVPAQYSVESKWDDGSVRSLGVDFNVSIGPTEARTYQVEYGPEVNRPASVPRGLSVVESPDAVQVGNVKFGRSGSPLIVSANYRGELIGQGQNGIVVTDLSGARHDLASAQQVSMEIVKRGPLSVAVQYRGRMPIDATYSVPFSITCEMPNSKSWIRTTTSIEDPAKRVKEIGFETPVALGEKPWTWDFGTENRTYGAFRNATDSVLLTELVSAKGTNSWTVQTGTQAELRPYESSVPGRAEVAALWGHILDARTAVAFAIDRFANEAGTYTISLNGQGQAAFRFAPAQISAQHRLVVYEHFVGTPVPIGAATSPTAMLNPLVVSVKTP